MIDAPDRVHTFFIFVMTFRAHRYLVRTVCQDTWMTPHKHYRDTLCCFSPPPTIYLHSMELFLSTELKNGHVD